MNENQNPQTSTNGVRPQIGLVEAVKICLQEKYCDFNGRARRSEFWWYALVAGIVSYLLAYIGLWLGGMTGYYVVNAIVGLALLLPGLGVIVRRLHDIGKSGWYFLIILIPIVGAIILLVWYCTDSQRTENEYGPSPKYQ